MAGLRGSSGEEEDKYTVLLPTYNERDNLPLIIWLLVRHFEERWANFTRVYTDILQQISVALPVAIGKQFTLARFAFTIDKAYKS